MDKPWYEEVIYQQMQLIMSQAEMLEKLMPNKPGERTVIECRTSDKPNTE